MADRTSAPSRGRSATLEPPSLDETPLVTKFGLSDAEYAELQEKRKCFKGLSISPRPYTAYGALKERDMLAFCAAGYFLWRMGETEAEVLMAWEASLILYCLRRSIYAQCDNSALFYTCADAPACADSRAR